MLLVLQTDRGELTENTKDEPCIMAPIVSEQVRQLLAEHGQLPVAVSSLDDNADLYSAGLKSFAVVQVMLALEDAFETEFPERMLVRRTFSSIASIEACVNELLSERGASK